MNKLLGRIVQYFNVSFINAVIGVFSSAILTRVFEKDVYGKISFFTSTSAVMFSLTCMGMDSAFMRFYYEPPNQDTKAGLYKKNLYIIAIIFAVYSTLLFIVKKYFVLLFDETSTVVLVSFLINVFAQVLLRYSNLYFRMEEKVNQYAMQSISSQICSKLLIIVGLLFSGKFVDIVLMNSMLLFGISIFWTGVVKNKLTKDDAKFVDLNGYSVYFRYALLTFPIDLIFYLNTYISQYIIKRNLSIEMVGVYSALSIFISAISVFKVGFNNFWNPYIYKNYKTKQETIKNIHSIMLVVCVLIEIGILIFSDLIYFILGRSYRTNKEILGFLILGQILLFIQETTAYGTLIEKKNQINLLYNIVYVVIRIGLCSILSIKLGILGVSISDAVSAICLLIMSSYYGQKYYKTISSIWRSAVSILCICSISLLYFFLYSNKVCFIFVCVMLLIFVYFVNRQAIKVFYSVEIKSRSKQ